MPATVIDAVKTPFLCVHQCFERLSLEDRVAGITALYRFDDAMRGWGQTVLWDLAAPTMWRVQQHIGNAKWVSVRDSGCVYSRLVGFCIHELIHAVCADPTLPNYGVPTGIPYGVPESLPVGEEGAYLHTFNQQEARAWVGLDVVAHRLFNINWTVLPARDVGTYGFVGGNAMNNVPDGYRRVNHFDHQHHPRRYYALARAVEDEALGWFTPAKLDEIAAQFEAAERVGREAREARKQTFPSPREMAQIRPRRPGRNDMCVCGSMKKWKHCHGAQLQQ